jgi:hypothetical protein
VQLLISFGFTKGLAFEGGVAVYLSKPIGVQLLFDTPPIPPPWVESERPISRANSRASGGRVAAILKYFSA